jgi:hypothetical protein
MGSFVEECCERMIWEWHDSLMKSGYCAFLPENVQALVVRSVNSKRLHAYAGTLATPSELRHCCPTESGLAFQAAELPLLAEAEILQVASVVAAEMLQCVPVDEFAVDAVSLPKPTVPACVEQSRLVAGDKMRYFLVAEMNRVHIHIEMYMYINLCMCIDGLPCETPHA